MYKRQDLDSIDKEYILQELRPVLEMCIRDRPNTDFSSMQEKIIYSAELSIQVDEYDKTIKDIKQYVKDVKGFIERSSTYTPQYGSKVNESIKSGQIIIRIPSIKFDEALDKICLLYTSYL